jgi:hypothetical protein
MVNPARSRARRSAAALSRSRDSPEAASHAGCCPDGKDGGSGVRLPVRVPRWSPLPDSATGPWSGEPEHGDDRRLSRNRRWHRKAPSRRSAQRDFPGDIAESRVPPACGVPVTRPLAPRRFATGWPCRNLMSWPVRSNGADPVAHTPALSELPCRSEMDRWMNSRYRRQVQTETPELARNVVRHLLDLGEGTPGHASSRRRSGRWAPHAGRIDATPTSRWPGPGRAGERRLVRYPLPRGRIRGAPLR